MGEEPTAMRPDDPRETGAASADDPEAGVSYPDRSMPASRKVDGAFGKEPADAAPTEGDKS